MRKHHGKYKQLTKELVYIGPQGMHADYCLIVKGDIPREGMKDGDIVFLEKSQELRNGKLAYIDIDGKSELKRVYIGGGVHGNLAGPRRLYADNKDRDSEHPHNRLCDIYIETALNAKRGTQNG